MDPSGTILAIDIPLEWTSVTVKGENFPRHQGKIRSRRAKDKIKGPQIYRWVLRKRSGEISAVYIGQTEDFEIRLRAYREGKSGCDGSVVQSAMKECDEDGGSVELQFLDLVKGAFRMNGTPINRASLGEPDVRLMMESIAIVAARADGVRLLNQVRENAYMKILLRAAAILGPVSDRARELFKREVRQAGAAMDRRKLEP